jgi:hypothetical protein
MTYSLTGQLARHLYCYVDSSFTHKESVGFVPCVWFGLVSYPGRMWGCTVMLESGAIYRNVPPHAIAFCEKPKGISTEHFGKYRWEPKDAQTWDCYGTDFTVLEYNYLQGLDCEVMANKEVFNGTYLFTVAPVGDAYSAAPEQAKEFVFVKLDNGRLTIQPTNNVLFTDRSFTNDEGWPKGLKRQTATWSCE